MWNSLPIMFSNVPWILLAKNIGADFGVPAGNELFVAIDTVELIRVSATYMLGLGCRSSLSAKGARGYRHYGGMRAALLRRMSFVIRLLVSMRSMKIPWVARHDSSSYINFPTTSFTDCLLMEGNERDLD